MGEIFGFCDLWNPALDSTNEGLFVMVLLSADDFLSKGIRISRTQLYRFIAIGKFPRPIKIGKKNFWLSTEIEEYIKSKIAERDEVSK